MSQPALTTSNSSVQVEYHDPHGVFKHIEDDLNSRLPLRSLSWNSPQRPLRLIDTLYLNIVSSNSSERASDAAEGESDGGASRKERRHQIPGLRRTPYLKILLVKCEDADAYKATTRKEIREWIKLHTPPSQKTSKTNNQENHDAFEWMIWHIAVSDSPQKFSWPDRATSKILDYLKVDFNSSSKGSLDRIAQTPPLHVSAADSNNSGSSNELFKEAAGHAWDDLVTKIKTQILSSFDQRVRQYEEDIKEKGAQRNLPGFNFNTFFVLKEGLARGFESVGLIEDALRGYDELDVEFDSAVRSKHTTASATQDATIFRSFSPELTDAFTRFTQEPQEMTSIFGNRILDVTRKPYRDSILSSDISILDFKIYIFGRQLSLLHRLGFPNKNAGGSPSTYDLRYVCDICQRGIALIASTSAALRAEASSCWNELAKSETDSAQQCSRWATQLVCAWTYHICLAVLDLSRVEEVAKTNESVSKPPAGKSLPVDMNDKPLPQPQAAANSASQMKLLLSSQRASLLRAARRALEEAASLQGWRSGWKAVVESMTVLNFTEREKSPQDLDKPEKIPTDLTSGLHRSFQELQSSEATFRDTVGRLTRLAIECYAQAGDAMSLQAARLDLATDTFLQGKYNVTLQQLETLLEGYRRSAWAIPETLILAMISRCYIHLNKPNEYVKAALALATSLVKDEQNQREEALRSLPSAEAVLEEAIRTSHMMQDTIDVDLKCAVDSFSIHPYITHTTDGSGIAVDISLKNHHLGHLPIDNLSLHLQSVDNNVSQDLFLTSSDLVLEEKTMNKISASTTEVIPGTYRACGMSMLVGKLRFSYISNDASDSTMPTQSHTETFKNAESLIRVWQAEASLDTKLAHFEIVDLGHSRSVLLTLTNWGQAASKLRVRLRAATSGLRLHIARAEVLSTGFSISDSTSDDGIAITGELDKHANVRLRIPYSLEYDVKHVSIRVSVMYERDGVSCRLEKIHQVSVLLPLGVNVQDVFKSDVLFSRFSISTANGLPLGLVKYELNESPDYEICKPPGPRTFSPITARQPASLTYKILRKGTNSTPIDAAQKLRLNITYCCLEEELLSIFENLLIEQLRKSDQSQYTNLLGNHFMTIFATLYTKEDLEKIAISSQVDFVSYESVQWQQILSLLPWHDRERVESWLREWHSQSNSIRLPDVHEWPQRLVRIPVDIPPMHQVHTASLHLLAQDVLPDLRVGSAIPAELTLSCTGKWSNSSSAGEFVDAIFELDSPAENWVIGGERRGVFRPSEGIEAKFVVILIPQRAGHLPFPSLDVRLMHFDTDRPIHSELDYKDAARSVLVLPGYRTPTVGALKRGDQKSILLQA